MPSLFGNSFFIHRVARESVLFLSVDAQSFLPAHCVGFVLSAGIVRRSFFFSPRRERRKTAKSCLSLGGASFVLYLRSVEDRMCT